MTTTEITREIGSSISQHHVWWDWQIPVYLFLGGIVAGLMILTSYRYLAGKNTERSVQLRLLTWMAPVLLSVGMLALWLDLADKLNAYRFYLAFIPTSPMSWGAWILLAVYPVTVLYALSELPENWRARVGKWPLGKYAVAMAKWADRDVIKNRLAWGGVICGVALGIYTGILLANVSARPLWNTAILGPLFLTSGLSTGAAFMLLFRLREDERHIIGRLDLAFISMEITMLFLYLISLANGNLMEQNAVSQLLGGGFTMMFWILVVFIGLVVPFIAEINEIFGRAKSRWVIPVLILVGGLSLRWVLVFAGQTAL